VTDLGERFGDSFTGYVDLREFDCRKMILAPGDDQ
jgi:hypothetical protein